MQPFISKISVICSEAYLEGDHKARLCKLLNSSVKPVPLLSPSQPFRRGRCISYASLFLPQMAARGRGLFIPEFGSLQNIA